METNPQETEQVTSPFGCLIPVYWALVGNGILALAALSIAHAEQGWPIIADVVYWAIVGSLLSARYVDIRYLGGQTSEGEPATMGHFRRYASRLVAIAGVVWCGAHAVRYYLTRGEEQVVSMLSAMV